MILVLVLFDNFSRPFETCTRVHASGSHDASDQVIDHASSLKLLREPTGGRPSRHGYNYLVDFPLRHP